MLFNSDINRKKLASSYLWVTICGGGLIYFVAAYRLDLKLIDLKLAVIAVLGSLSEFRSLTLRSRFRIPLFF